MNDALTKKLDIALQWDRSCEGDGQTNSTVAMKGWVIVGERDSGTNHAQKLVSANFADRRVEPFWKHMYDKDDAWFNRYLKTTGMAWVFIVRDPAQWLEAMYDNHHECDEMVAGRSFVQFLRATPWKSISHRNGVATVLADTYKDVLELRRVKLKYMKLALEHAARNPGTHRGVFVEHEDSAADPEAVLCKIRNRLGLRPLRPTVSIRLLETAACTRLRCPPPSTQMHLELNEAREWMNRKKGKVAKVIERTYLSDGSGDAREAAKAICEGLDWELEAWFGYARPPMCK